MTIFKLIEVLQNNFPDLFWTLPSSTKFGFLTSNSTFKIAKIEKNSPQNIAENFTSRLNDFFVAKKLPFKATPDKGYLNLELQPKLIKNLFKQPEKFFTLKKIKKTVFLDYFAPNIGKEFHIGNVRAGNMGETLRRVLSLKYEKVITDNHLGDWGVQFSLIIWGLQNFTRLNLDFQKPDLNNKNTENFANQFFQIYVAVNKEMEKDETIKITAGKIQTKFEQEILEYEKNLKNPESLIYLWKKIIQISLASYHQTEKYLHLNAKVDFLENKQLFSSQIYNQIQKQKLAWEVNLFHKNGHFDIVLGESFYLTLIQEVDVWVKAGLVKKDGDSVFIDLKEEKLGRCYLISSNGYSSYALRDVLARFVWSGVFGGQIMLTVVDTRQKHSFAQAFSIVKKIVDSKIYEKRNFGWLNKIQTQRSLKILKDTASLKHLGFGFLTLPEGAMSTRKGKIFTFAKLKNLIEEKTVSVLQEKNQQSPDTNLVQKIAVSTLKWIDLYRAREMDVVFEIDKFLQFEGNTGVYQLYTIARIHSIFEKNRYRGSQLAIDSLTKQEVEMVNQVYTFPLTLEQVALNYEPHILTNYLFNLATQFNSWYSQTSILKETDLNRKNTMLKLIETIQKTQIFGLTLLGIEPVKKI